MPTSPPSFNGSPLPPTLPSSSCLSSCCPPNLAYGRSSPAFNPDIPFHKPRLPFHFRELEGGLSFNGSESGPTRALTKFNSGQSSCFCCPQVSSYLCLRISAIIQLLLPETWEPAYTPLSTVVIKPIDSITRIHLLCFLPSSKSVTPPLPTPGQQNCLPTKHPESS